MHLDASDAPSDASDASDAQKNFFCAISTPMKMCTIISTQIFKVTKCPVQIYHLPLVQDPFYTEMLILSLGPNSLLKIMTQN